MYRDLALGKKRISVTRYPKPPNEDPIAIIWLHIYIYLYSQS